MKNSSLSDDEKVRIFQRKLYYKAKHEEQFCFYVLYDKMQLPYFLREAYRRVKRNGGSPGIDGQTFTNIEDDGLDCFLEGIREELQMERYRPSAVLRVEIPKGNGTFRPLGIPTIKDRVVQMACKMVIEPIFEADFLDCSYGFRPKRSAEDAITEIKFHLRSGKTTVFDADLSSYFDTIPHNNLLSSVKTRISDNSILRLLSLWLKCPVYENNRYHGGKKNVCGTPQGGVISPLLSNIYLHNLDKIIGKKEGIFAQNDIALVRYADDFLLMGKDIPDSIIKSLDDLLQYMGLKLNNEKSKMVYAPKESFDFLGFTFRLDRSLFGLSDYWNVVPSDKSQKKINSSVREHFRYGKHYKLSEFIGKLNSKIRGWINYFHIRGVSFIRRSCEKLRYYLHLKFQVYYRRKSQRVCKLYRQYGFDAYVRKFGVYDPVQAYNQMKYVKAL